MGKGATLPQKGGAMEKGAADKNQVEGFKYLDDFFKQLITLSTGSLVLLATFAERFKGHGRHPILAAGAVMFFILTILGCLALKAIYAGKAEWGDFAPIEGKWATIATVVLVAASLAFVLALTFLGIFGITTLS
jgi:hypothetical protein